MRPYNNLVLTSVICSLGLLSCGGGGGSSAPADTTPPSVSFSPAALTVTGGQTGTSTLSVSDNAGITAGPTVSCTNGGTFSGSTFTAPNVTVNTTSICTASASDAAGNSASATLTVTIEPANQPPVAVITSNISEIDEGQTLTLDGTGSSDPEGGALTYAWTQTAGPSATLSAPSLPTLSVTLPQVTQNETLTFELAVSDGNRKSRDSVDVVSKDVTSTAFNGDDTQTPGAFLVSPGFAPHLKGLTLEPDGNYRAYWDYGPEFEDIDTVSKLFDPDGSQIGAQTDGRFSVGTLEFTTEISSVIRSGADIIYTFLAITDFPPAERELLAYSHSGLVDGVVTNSPRFFRITKPNESDFSIESTATVQDTTLTTDTVVTLITYNRDFIPARTFMGMTVQPAIPALDYQVEGVVRNSDGSTSRIPLDTSPLRMTDATVAALTEGNFLGLYTVTEVGSDNLYYARANIDGTNITRRVAVDLNPTSDQDEPHVARLSSGQAFAAWRDGSGTLGDASGTSIKGRVIGADGSFLTGTFLVNAAVDGNQSKPHVTALDNERALVVWLDEGGATPQVRGQIFDVAGQPLINEFSVDVGPTNPDLDRFRSVALTDGRIVVGWSTTVKADGSFRVTLDPLGR